MRDREKSTPLTPADTDPLEPFDPEVSIFREVGLQHVPPEWRSGLRQLGVWLFDWSLEKFGIANEEPDTGPFEPPRTGWLSPPRTARISPCTGLNLRLLHLLSAVVWRGPEAG